MSAADIFGRVAGLFVLAFTASLFALLGVAVLRASIHALQYSLLFATLTVGAAAVPLVLVYLTRAAVGKRASEAERANYFWLFLVLAVVTACLFAYLLISGLIAFPTPAV